MESLTEKKFEIQSSSRYNGSNIRLAAADLQGVKVRGAAPLFFSGRRFAVADWFYRTPFGDEKGPLAGSELLELIRRGEVKGNTEIRKDKSPWVAACEVSGLWQAVGRPSVEFKCPHCGNGIPKPPTICNDCRKEVSKAVGHLVPHQRPKDQEPSWNAATNAIDKPKAPPLRG